MNTKCPQCGQPVADDFGVIVCPHCQAVLFVDLAGNIQLSDSTSAAVMTEQENEILEEAAEQEEAVYVMSNAPPEGLDLNDLPATGAQSQETQFGTLARFHEEPPADPEFESVEPEAMLEPEMPEEPAVEETDPVDDFVDHEPSVAGPLSYTVTIEHIDTKNLRSQLQDVFDDPKLQWSSGELIKRIRMGKLTLKNLSPVKASVLISKIKELPLKISWTQQVYK